MALKRLKTAIKTYFGIKKEYYLPAPLNQENKATEKEEPITVKNRMPKENELALGYCHYEDEETKEYIEELKGMSQKDRDTHFYIVGATRSGKTKFLEFLIWQDIIQGKGFGVIDPHGDLIENIKGLLYLYSEKSLKNDVVLIDPSDLKNTATFNPLEKTKGITSGELAGELILAFEKIWHDFWGPRMENILRNSLIALSENNLTLAEIPPLLTNASFRKKVLEKVENQDCRDYFINEFEPLNPKARREWTESTLNKVHAFLANDKARHIFASQKSSFNLRKIIDEQKILLVNLAKGKLRDISALLGSLLMSKIQMAAFSRTDIAKSKRTPFYLYIDEFQNIASKSFIEVLSEAAKYGLSLTMAHQGLAQLPRDLQASILTNCGAQAYFKVSREDADILAKEGFRVTGKEIKDMRIGENSIDPIYQPLQEEWETYIQTLQDSPKRIFTFTHTDREGVAEFMVPDMPDPWKRTKQDEETFKRLLKKRALGKKYLKSRKTIEKNYQKRRKEFAVNEEPSSFESKTKKLRIIQNNNKK